MQDLDGRVADWQAGGTARYKEAKYDAAGSSGLVRGIEQSCKGNQARQDRFQPESRRSAVSQRMIARSQKDRLQRNVAIDLITDRTRRSTSFVARSANESGVTSRQLSRLSAHFMAWPMCLALTQMRPSQARRVSL